jgi:hypothetical protein
LDSVRFGHFRRGQNDFEFAVDMREFFDAYRADVEKWLGETVTSEIEAQRQAFHVIVSPLTSRNAAFVASVNDKVFKGGAQVVGIEVEAEFKDSFAVRHADLAALRTDLAGTGLPMVLHYVDDATVRGLSLLRLRSLLTDLFDTRSEDQDERPAATEVRIFQSVIVLINRWSPNTWASLLGGPLQGLHCYADVWAPHLSTFASLCPLCERDDHLHKVEDGCSTAMLAAETRALRMRETAATRFDSLTVPGAYAEAARIRQEKMATDPAGPAGTAGQGQSAPWPLVRSLSGERLSDVVVSEWAGRQSVGRRRLWWRHLLTHGLRHLGQHQPHRCDRDARDCGPKDLVNCPSIVAAHLIERLTWIAKGTPSGSGQDVEWPLDNFAAAIWAATTGELAARKSVREASLAIVNGLLSALLRPDALLNPPDWNGQPTTDKVEAGRRSVQDGWQDLLEAVHALAGGSGGAEGFEDDANGWESLLRCLMRASAELGGTFLLRRRRMLEVFNFGKEHDLPLSRLAAFYAYCLKLLTSPGADRSRSAYLDHLLLTGQEDLTIASLVAASEDDRLKTVGKRFVERLRSEEGFAGIAQQVWDAVAEFADVAYLENTKCLQAVLDDMGSTRGNVDLDGYLPEHSAECLTGRWPSRDAAQDEAEPRAQILLAALEAFSEQPDGHDGGQGAGNGYDELADRLNQVWATFLGREPDECSASLVVETKKKDMLRRTPIAALPTAKAIQYRFDADSIGLTIEEQFSVTSGPGRQYLDVGWHGGAQGEESKVETLAQRRFLQAEWCGNLGEPIGFAHVKERDRRDRRDRREDRPSITFGFQDGWRLGPDEEDGKRVWCLIRLGLATDADGGSPDQDAYMAFEAPGENVDVASLMNAARAVALFRGKMADKLRPRAASRGFWGGV